MEPLTKDTDLIINHQTDTFSLINHLFQTLRGLLVETKEEASQGTTYNLALYSHDMPHHYFFVGDYRGTPFEYRVFSRDQVARVVRIHGHSDLTQRFFEELNNYAGFE